MTKKEKDFATGKAINRAHPEEVVRQEYENILHFDFGYPKECIDINVPISMGVSRKSSDIVIYDNPKKRNIIGIVETKAPKQTVGREQLESYMSATSTCRWGVWTNGDELKVAVRDIETGEITFDRAYPVPRYGELDANIREFADLRPASNLKWIFRLISNRLYANTNLARTEKQGAEMVRLIFCKLVDEYEIRGTKNVPAFQVRQREDDSETRERINSLWEKTKKGAVGQPIFHENEKIEIDDYSLQVIVSSLQGYSLLQTDRDIVGEAFEVFSERQFAGEKGQFFTPRFVVKMVVSMIQPTAVEKIIDPACGSGGFLISALSHITSEKQIDDEEKKRIAEHCLYGIDKDPDLSKICKAHMSIIGDGKSNIVTADSLKATNSWDNHAKSKLLKDGKLIKFDVLITNPPFGSKIKVEQRHVLQQYDLGHKWRRQGNLWEKTTETKPTPPQILFIERCLEFLKDGGRMGIVLPDGILGNQRDSYIRQWIESKAEILAVVDCPVETFMPHTGTKTSVIIMRKHKNSSNLRDRNIFFGIAEHCGHTPRGKPIIKGNDESKEDFTSIARNYHAKSKSKSNYLGFYRSNLSDGILVPRYYDPRILKEIRTLKKTGDADMVSIGELQKKREIEVTNLPASVKSEEYDLHGDIRFVRTSDIAGYELYERPQKMVSYETYLLYKEGQDLQINDILFVKDGDNKIGQTAILLDEHDRRILVQAHFKKIRAIEIDPFLLLWLLNTAIVRKQIRQRVFNQSTLSTIGERIDELLLPLPKNKKRKETIIREVRSLVSHRRMNLRKLRELMS